MNFSKAAAIALIAFSGTTSVEAIERLCSSNKPVQPAKPDFLQAVEGTCSVRERSAAWHTLRLLIQDRKPSECGECRAENGNDGIWIEDDEGNRECKAC